MWHQMCSVNVVELKVIHFKRYAIYIIQNDVIMMSLFILDDYCEYQIWRSWRFLLCMYYDIDNQELVSQLYNLLDIDNVVFKVD